MRKRDDIERLFREKFEGYRITPSEGLWSRVVRRLRRQEFLHFSPGRFNVWYLAGLLTVGVVVAYLALQDHSAVTGSVTPETSVGVVQNRDHLQGTSEEKAVKGMTEEEQREEHENAGSEGHPAAAMPAQNQADQEKQLPVGRPATPPPAPGNGTPAKATGSQPVQQEKDHTTPSTVPAEKEKPAPVARFELSVRKGCPPLTVDLINLSEYATDYSWDIEPAGVRFTEISPQYTFHDPGLYVVHLTARDQEGHISVSSDTVEVYGKPRARFDYSPKDAVVPADEICFYDNSVDAERYLWSFGDGHTSTESDPVHKYTTDGPFDVVLTVWSAHGCVDSMVLRNVFEHSGYYLRFPNAFVPNPGGPTGGYYSEGSLANDVFHPVWKGVGDYHLQIFNRRGELVFESRELNRGWDGYILGQLATPGVYIWKARGTFLNGKPFVRFGNVTLIRKR